MTREEQFDDNWKQIITRCAEMDLQKGRATGFIASNGMMYVGDKVHFEDGKLCFTTEIIDQQGKIGFYLDDSFVELEAFVQSMTIFPEQSAGAEIDFTIEK